MFYEKALGGGAKGACERGALAWAQASQGGLWVTPAKGFGSRRRLGRSGVGCDGVNGAVVIFHKKCDWVDEVSNTYGRIPDH